MIVLSKLSRVRRMKMSDKLDKIMDRQRERYRFDRYKRYSMYLSLMTVLFIILQSVALLPFLDYKTALHYDWINVRILVIITSLYFIRYYFFNHVEESFTMVLMSGYMIGTIAFIYIDALWAYPITAITAYIFLLYSVIDLLLGYNIFEPIAHKFSPIAYRKYMEELEKHEGENDE